MKIQNANTILYCLNWPASVHFYKDLMGLQPSFVREDWFIELRVSGGAHLSLADAARCTIAAGEGRGLTLSFQVADLAAIREHFIRHQLEPGPLKERHDWRAPYFYIHDPEGNRIEFWSAARPG